MSDALTLAAARIEKNLSQAQLADVTNISQTTISQLENGLRQPQQSTRETIEQVLGSVHWQRTFDFGRSSRQIINN